MERIGVTKTAVAKNAVAKTGVEKRPLRQPEDLMSAEKLGAFHTSYLSFSRSLIRTAIRDKWQIKCKQFGLDKAGFGSVIYHIKTPNHHYHAVFFTDYLPAEQRNDRVIAQAWDMCCCLVAGDVNQADIDALKHNLPQQELGRYRTNVLSISRANKSMRLFDYVRNCLAQGKQPDQNEIQKTGYLVRTTAVYGNGKFGIADYAQLQNGDFAEHFRAQMLMVYMVRHFTIEWVEYLAHIKNPQRFVKLSKHSAMFLGTGNSTGLGMLPFLIKHPDVIHTWISQREQALYEIINTPADTKTAQYVAHLIQRACDYFSAISVPDETQTHKNQVLTNELNQLLAFVSQCAVSTTLWQRIYDEIKHQSLSDETNEVFLNIMLEAYPHISCCYEHFCYQDDPEELSHDLTPNDLINIIERHYQWALDIDFEHPDDRYYFWYHSEDKEEPRRGQYGVEAGAEHQMQIAIARDVNHLYQTLQNHDKNNTQVTLATLLNHHPEHISAINRILAYHRRSFGEIRTNVLAKNFYPIDILRLKLSFFGAVKFDPKSDKWLRITLFQGAPLIADDGYIDPDDDWFLYQYKQPC